MFQLLFSTTLLLAGGASTAETTLIGRYVLPSENKTYGGFSAIEIGDNGTSMIAVSDRGGFAIGTIKRNADGTIADIAVGAPVEINTGSASASTSIRDAEGLAIAADGTIYISFEGDHRIGRFATPTALEDTLPTAAEFAAFASNSGLEALAIDDAGTLFAIPERTRRRADPFPVYRFKDGVWDIPYEIPRTGDLLMVGADFAPDGRLYVLERQVASIGFYTRVRRIDLETFTAEVILETGLGVHGNMEGISVWENDAGETIMTLIADDNYRRILNNEIAEYRIDG